jgi:hypothetical protein
MIGIFPERISPSSRTCSKSPKIANSLETRVRTSNVILRLELPSLDFHAPPLNAKFGQKVAEMAYSYLSH